MTDLTFAVDALKGHSLALCKNGIITTDDGRGIMTLLRFVETEKNLAGYSVADIIVGKAAAMLFDKLGVVAIHAVVMSKAAKAYLDMRGIECEYETLTEQIINREGTAQCPMEDAVSEIDDLNDGVLALIARREALRAKSGA